MAAWDLAVVLGWLGFSAAVGLWFRRRASHSPEGFFVGDRKLPWWVVGTSMVATTFAADTPLAVSGYVAAGGIAANWRWWFAGVGSVATVFLFARLWSRARVITEAELVELRYGGRASQWLRGLKAIWFGVFLNLLVIAWVMRAMRKVVAVVLQLPPDATWAGLSLAVWVVLGLFLLAVTYTSASGLYGVVATDVIQFPVALAGSVILAGLALHRAGGVEGLQQGFAVHGFDWQATTRLLPLSDPAPDGQTAQLLVLFGVVWWASRGVDGGSYIAQRLLAARDERHALWGYAWFALAHLCLRPWPWIVAGLCGMALLGPQPDPEAYYPLLMREVLPEGLFGLMVAAFLAAFMSTIDTQLHWGASLLINDAYGRFVARDQNPERLLRASRVAVLALASLGAAASFAVEDIRGAWELALSVTAGLGAVHIARWYWWRTNAYSELTALLVAALGSGALGALRPHHAQLGGAEPWAWLSSLPPGWLSFPFDLVAVVAVSIPSWVLVTLLTPPGDRDHLRAFYRRVRPGGPGWRAVAGDLPGFASDGPGRGTWLGIAAGVVALYGSLLGLGMWLLGRSLEALGLGALAVAAGALCARQMVRETTCRAGP